MMQGLNLNVFIRCLNSVWILALPNCPLDIFEDAQISEETGVSKTPITQIIINHSKVLEDYLRK